MAIQVEEFIQKIDGMSVLELNNLVKALEEHYGVSAAQLASWQAARMAAMLPRPRYYDVNRVRSDPDRRR